MTEEDGSTGFCRKEFKKYFKRAVITGQNSVVI